jgi:prolyl oligopeptidase
MQYGWKTEAFTVPNLRRRIWKKWHDAGTKLQKQNVFDDFIAAAEYLIAQNILLRFLAIGGSNGGLLGLL